VSALGSPIALRRIALASVAANVGIVITGGAVRLTGSGLGCPTWPQCTEESFTFTPEMGIHGAIEYGNRLLTVVVGLVALLGVVTALAQRPRRSRVTRLAIVAFLGIPAQAVLGGVTVLTGLNPWIVGAHFLLSMAIIAVAFAFWVAAREGDGPIVPTVPRWLRGLAGLLTVVSAAVLVAGTVVTGSGPHAGDPEAGRNGLSSDAVSQLHVDLVFLLIGLSVAMWFALRAVGAERAAVRAAWLVAVELAQGFVGFVQHFTNLPPLVVALHMAGACAVWVATLALWHATRIRLGAPEPAGGMQPAAPSLAGERA
jgi:cytochrome c oxidase assembly protein subunit 15